jgi:hypothetical protein
MGGGSQSVRQSISQSVSPGDQILQLTICRASKNKDDAWQPFVYIA